MEYVHVIFIEHNDHSQWKKHFISERLATALIGYKGAFTKTMMLQVKAFQCKKLYIHRQA